ncbi:MAG: fumarylacetoacetate hydrolase family protein [Tissierellia bacterium]|nr:fumarylacetoacetate hydrolase family protein [Tissierellia bacterium]
MKYVSYIYDNLQSYGILNANEDSVIPMKAILDKMDKEVPSSLLAFIQKYSDRISDEISNTLNNSNLESIALDNVKITAPIPNPPRNVFCLGKNYEEHVLEVQSTRLGKDSKVPDYPIYFTKIADSIIGPMDKVIIPKDYTEKIDYEVELAVIIGKDGKDISQEKAEEYIFGYTIGNDISARDIQVKHNQWFKGKSLDTFTPMGPYLVDKSEIKFPVELDISCKINDELRQNSNTRHLIFDIAYIIADLSKGLTLKAGDIILTGTPSGVGVGFKPHKYLKSGDTIECYVEKIGSLTNMVD